MRTGRPIVPTLAFVATLALVAITAHAEPATRKPGRHSQPASTSRTAPDTTGTIPIARRPKPAILPPVEAKRTDDEPLQAPYKLPQASRERMRACGLRWQQMKMSGDTGDEVWRDYATKCLASTDRLAGDGSPEGGPIRSPRDGQPSTRAP